MEKILVRYAQEEDVGVILEFIKELADDFMAEFPGYEVEVVDIRNDFLLAQAAVEYQVECLGAGQKPNSFWL